MSDLNELFNFFCLEDVSGEVVGKKEQEIEHVWFGKIELDKLKALEELPYVTRVLQEQFTAKLDTTKENPHVNTVLRARRVNREGAVLTRKTRIEGQVGSIEESIEISNEIFEFFTRVVGTGIMKIRYTIKPDGFERKLELDVFLDKTGNIPGDGTYAYAKYDYEVGSEDQQPPQLPIELVDSQYLNPFDENAGETAVNLRAFMKSQAFRV